MGMALKAYDAVGDLFLLTTISLSSKYLSDEQDLDFLGLGTSVMMRYPTFNERQRR